MIIVTGSIAFDHIMNFPGSFSDHIKPEKLHVLSVSFLVDTLKKEKGGTAANISYSLGLLGINPLLLGCVGKDFGEYGEFLSKAGVNTSGVNVIPEVFTSSAFITTDQNDNQITGFYPGAMRGNKELRILNYELKNENNLVVISPNDPEAMGNFVNECIENKIPYMYDPGMQLPRLSDEDLERGVSHAKILIGNDYEMSVIESRTKNYESRTKNIDIIITTLGANGAEIKFKVQGSRFKVINIPSAKPEMVIDPTGAGDAFRGGFLAGYLRGLPLETCGRMGSLAAVYTVEKYGTVTHSYMIEEFSKRYKENFGETLSL